MITEHTKRITVHALKQFGDKRTAKAIKNLHTLPEESQIEILHNLPPVLWYGDFTDVLPSAPIFYEIKVAAESRGWRLQSAKKVCGSVWDSSTASRRSIESPVLRLVDHASGGHLDFESPHDESWLRFYRFELPVRNQGKGLGCALFVSFFEELMAQTDHLGMESTILATPERQPMFWDSRRNWRFDLQDGHTKLFNWWSKLGGQVLDQGDPQRMYFVRGKVNCISKTDTLAA